MGKIIVAYVEWFVSVTHTHSQWLENVFAHYCTCHNIRILGNEVVMVMRRLSSNNVTTMCKANDNLFNYDTPSRFNRRKVTVRCECFPREPQLLPNSSRRGEFLASRWPSPKFPAEFPWKPKRRCPAWCSKLNS